MITRGKLWNSYYRGWFAARSDRPRPIAESMVEHSFVVDGYMEGKSSGGNAAPSQIPLAAQPVPETPDNAEALCESVGAQSAGSAESELESELKPESVESNTKSAQ